METIKQQKGRTRIAALLTCHNRKEKTLRCLATLRADERGIDVYLVDDGCTDGTAQAVALTYPKVNILTGDGTLFWSRGMYTAWTEALKGDYDFYLWLNDDTILDAGFMGEMLRCYDLAGYDCIISGLVANASDKAEILYGGYNKNKELIGESPSPQDITYMNGNVVLVPRSVVERIGIIDKRFQHDFGDADYSLTAIEHGIKVVTTTRAVAFGYPNNFCRVRMWGTNIVGRFRTLATPLGSPLWQNFYFHRKHFGVVHAVAFCSYLVLINLLPDKIVAAVWGNKYKDK